MRSWEQDSGTESRDAASESFGSPTRGAIPNGIARPSQANPKDSPASLFRNARGALAPPCRVLFETMGRGPVWLVGMMGAGKSAVGPLLACSLARRFGDTDISRKEFGFGWR
jgi:hypothetical protein